MRAASRRLLLAHLSCATRCASTTRGRPWTHAAAVSAGDASTDDGVVFTPVGVFCGAFAHRNGTPRQGALVPRSRGVVRLFDDVLAGGGAAALAGLDGFSHCIILFHFHDTAPHRAAAKVAPPRLSGARVGLFATRAPHRPNGIGLSVVKVERVTGTELHVSGCDLLSDTPVLDIKPYVPYADCFVDATVPPWLSAAPDTAPAVVEFTPAALDELVSLERALVHLRGADDAKAAISDVLRTEVRSAYRRRTGGDSDYSFTIDSLDVRCAFDDAASRATVTRVSLAAPLPPPAGDAGATSAPQSSHPRGHNTRAGVSARDAATFSALLSRAGLACAVAASGAVRWRVNGVLLGVSVGAAHSGAPAVARYDPSTRILTVSISPDGSSPSVTEQVLFPVDELVSSTSEGWKGLRTTGLYLLKGPAPGGACGWLRPGQGLGVAPLWDALHALPDLAPPESRGGAATD